MDSDRKIMAKPYTDKTSRDNWDRIFMGIKYCSACGWKGDSLDCWIDSRKVYLCPVCRLPVR